MRSVSASCDKVLQSLATPENITIEEEVPMEQEAGSIVNIAEPILTPVAPTLIDTLRTLQSEGSSSLLCN